MSTTHGSAILNVEHVGMKFGGLTANADLHFDVHEGEILSLIGPNGAGKTTAFNIMTGFLKPTQGRVLFRGRDLSQTRPNEIARLGLARTFQRTSVFADDSVRDNVLMGGYHPTVREGMMERFEEVLDIFPRVRERLSQLAGSLSGGEQQMVAIARGLMAKPKLLMLDEPSLGLAPIIVGQMFDVIDRICKSGTTVLLVEQKAFHALKIADRAYVIENGAIAIENTGAGLLADPHIKTAYLGI